MTYNIDALKDALVALQNFKKVELKKQHKRFLFPYLCGTYFIYRKIDVLRIYNIAKKISNSYRDIKYLEVGCGNGDFLSKIREYIPNARGIEKNIDLFYLLNIPKPEYIDLRDIRWIGDQNKYDIIFIGWMDPGEDFRQIVSKKTDIVITTLDQGLSLAAEYEEFGFKKIAQWITPSWEDLNTEISNKYYSKLSRKSVQNLSSMRGAHNLFYIYSKNNEKSEDIRRTLEKIIHHEESVNERYGFEDILDDCGFNYMQILHNTECKIHKTLWKVDIFNE
ncbi:MAG: hypothetical protein ACPKQO_11775 [Nitrososphaeraceae archaeon]